MLTETKSRDIIYRQMRKVFGNKPFTKADFAKFFENGNRGGLDMMPVSQCLSHIAWGCLPRTSGGGVFAVEYENDQTWSSVSSVFKKIGFHSYVSDKTEYWVAKVNPFRAAWYRYRIFVAKDNVQTILLSLSLPLAVYKIYEIVTFLLQKM